MALLLDLPSGFKARVREFSIVECEDYAVSLQLIGSYLLHAESNPEVVKDLSRFRTRNQAEFDVIRDFVQAEPLNKYLALNVETAELGFVDTIPIEQRIELSRYVALHTTGIE